MKFEDGKIGMKVRCVTPNNNLIIGNIYIIKKFYALERFILEETNDDFSFHPWRFEPVTDFYIPTELKDALIAYYKKLEPMNTTSFYQEVQVLLKAIENTSGLLPKPVVETSIEDWAAALS